MVLFGGLITIPFWGYRSLPIAMTELMLTDLPHIKYHNKETYTEEEQKMLIDISQDRQKKIKEGGLAAMGLNLNLSKAPIDGNALIKNLGK